MDVDTILEKYGLTRDIATQYIDAITRMNQTKTAEELDVSRDTINRYKHKFREMSSTERSLLITTLARDRLLNQTSDY